MNELAHFLTAAYRSFGLAGSLIIILAMLFTALSYSGRKKERYSVLNHFISELGEAGVSSRAWIFNYGLIAGGLLLVPYVIGFGFILNDVWAIFASLAGLWTVMSCVLVGIFPMNNLAPHIKAATAFFRGGLVMVILYGVAILAQPAGQVKIPLEASIASVLAALSYGSFLFLGRLPENIPALTEEPDPDLLPERPRFWGLAALEWLVFASTMAWLLVNAFLF